MATVKLFKTYKAFVNGFVPGSLKPFGFINKRFATDDKEVEAHVESLIGDPAFGIYIDKDESTVEYSGYLSAKQLHKARKDSFGPSTGGLIGSSSLPPGFNTQAANAGIASSADVRGQVHPGSETNRVTSAEAADTLKAQLAGLGKAPVTTPATGTTPVTPAATTTAKK